MGLATTLSTALTWSHDVWGLGGWRRSRGLLLTLALLCSSRGERTLLVGAQDTKQICFKFAGPCPRYAEWAGSVDDSDYAYENMNSAQREQCLLRAKEYHEWCECEPGDRVIMVHMPSGDWAAYPPFPQGVPAIQAMAHARLWESAMRFRDSASDYAAPTGRFWVDSMPHVSGESGGRIASRDEGEDAAIASGSQPTGPRTFLDAARALNSQHHRNFTLAVLAAAEAAGDRWDLEGSPDHNSLLLGTFLDSALSSHDLTQDAASMKRLERCAWEGNNPVCHLALAYRKHLGVGVPQSCMQAVTHYRLVAQMGLTFQQMDGASFPMNDVRLSQFMEVRLQRKKDAEMEQQQERARRGDPVAAAAVGSHEYVEERDLHKAARLFQAAADEGDDWGLNNLGSMLLNGLGGLQKDHALAVQCFNRSALLVNPWGMYNLAVCYLHGYGVPPNHTAAFEWLNASAKWDNPAAHVLLGSRYRDGQV